VTCSLANMIHQSLSTEGNMKHDEQTEQKINLFCTALQIKIRALHQSDTKFSVFESQFSTDEVQLQKCTNFSAPLASSNKHLASTSLPITHFPLPIFHYPS